MEHHSLIFTLFLIFAGAAIFSTLALYMRQSLLVGYMIFGILFGPWGFKLISDIDLVDRVDDIGVIFLMFLLGLNLKPQNLLHMIGKTLGTTLISSSVFFIAGFLVGYEYGYSLAENLILGACMMFSSTIVSLKLLPLDTTKRQYIGELMVSILLLQDLLAVIVLLGVGIVDSDKLSFVYIISTIGALPTILLFVFLAERFILKRIFAKFAEIREYMFLVAITWCLGIAQLAETVGLSYEIGAFIAGIAIAASPVVLYISSQIQPIRDFFLVLFFFLIGASFNLHYLAVIIVPALILTIIFMVLKPMIFNFLLSRIHEARNVSWEIGVRLGQLSEFSLLIIFLADRSELIGHSVVYLVQAVTMLMFIASSYWVVIQYPIEKGVGRL
ncbi:MAG: cation:proton antiporter [Coxiellaceae bacterium]|jgi:Kef-type K+ transport system membrane component KefB|nr:cation:proton antiporter [Coxiellaceae bacterium]